MDCRMWRTWAGRAVAALALIAALGWPARVPAASGGAAPAVPPLPRTDCVLGLYEDEAMTQTSALVSGYSHTLYLGITYDATIPAQLSGVEFSVKGLEAFNVVVQPRDNPMVVLGTPAAPVGVDSIWGTGGMNIAWGQCLPGNRVLAQLTLVPKNGWPAYGALLEVRRRYPPTNAALPYPLITQCDDPYFTSQGVLGQRFLLGIAGTPACSLTGNTEFGSVPVGSAATRNFWVTNEGAGLLEGSVSLSGANFQLQETNLSYALMHGQQRQFTVQFSPPEVGVYSCTVQATDCTPLDFTGRANSATPIARLHYEPSFLGTEVTVEAQVYVPANYGLSTPTGWIQDESGRGIQVHGTGAANPLLYDTSNLVRVTGTVGRVGSTLRLDPVRFVTLVSGGHAPRVPTTVTPHDAASQAWEGTFIEVTSAVTSSSHDGEYRYVLRDGFGSVTVVVPANLGVPTIPLGEVITARGAGGYNSQFVEYLVRVGNATDVQFPGIPVCQVTGSTAFGPVPQGGSATSTCHITNTGVGLLQGLLSLSGTGFQLVSTTPGYALMHGEQKEFTVLFAPTAPGEYSCTVSGTGCEPIPFTGRTAPITSIATLHHDASFTGREVTVEAQVYVPANHAGGEPTGWIQDDSGRGIQVHGSGAADPLLDSTGNLLRVTGTVVRAGATLRLEPVRLVTSISSGNAPRNPVILSPHEAASGDWEGTFVEVTGAIASRRWDGTLLRYVVSDSWGPVTVVVPTTLGLPEFQTTDVITARGAGGYDGEYFIRVGNGTDVNLGGNPSCLGRRVIVGDVAGTLGQQVEIPVRIAWNPRPIDAYGLRIAFDGSALRFVGSRCCALTTGWQSCEARAVGRDTLVLGGFNAVPIPANTSGDLMCLTFEILACGGERHLTAFGLVDDLSGMLTCDGALSCTECLSNGDVNQDGLLTPQDAQCAFGTFLEGQSLPPDCDVDGHCEIAAGDVNCDAVVTPGDAVEIFDRWLGGNASPAHCFARPVANSDAFRTGAPVIATLGAGQVTVPIEMRATPGPAAFGVDIEFDPAAEFVELRRAPAAAQWPALAAHLVAPGRLRVGGFDAHGAPGETWVTIASLVFSSTQDTHPVRHVEWRERIAGGHGPAAIAPLTLDLEPPYPNPLRSGAVTVSLFVPAGTSQGIVVGIHDVAGRLVRQLHAGGMLPAGRTAFSWDGSDDGGQRVAAGLYLVTVLSGDMMRQRKLVVLQ